jgi:hypothetical protein
MTTLLIVLLLGAGILLGSGWLSARNEAKQLRMHNAALKRQLLRAQADSN